ncbi:TPA: hypothetical protein EYP70_01450, partial [Candidatus Bathyarchaeota archaeon]|nr:hypothetical protein [Candidatus Bathyarchaeota archaeon]
EVNVSFSGHRGYHVHIESEEVRDLNSISRKEIVDYITGTGLEAEFHGLEESRYGSNVLMGPHLGDLGWRGRIARGVYDFLLKAEREDLAKLGLRRNVEKSLMKNRDLILESWNLKGPWSLVKGVGIESWKVIIKKGIEAQAARIDTVVTTDIHRLIRLKNTLHGKTGLLKVELPIGDIESFDPLREAVAFKGGEVTVFIEEAPGFRIGEESYGPFNKEKVELPTAAALLLLCKGLAEVVE